VRRSAETGGNPLRIPAWLGFLDTYRTLCLAPSPEIRTILEEVKRLQLPAAPNHGAGRV
jgi:hypothetical protein